VIKQWTEFTPPTYPSNMRRGVGVDSKSNVWFGIYAAGPRPAKLGKLDQTTGTPVNQPVVGKFNPRDQTFTFYPKPQIGADSPKLQHTIDRTVWYTARTGTRGATGFGVLYPDMDRITPLSGYPLNGPPGYAFKPSASGRKTN
jgi:hypothetical protein